MANQIRGRILHIYPPQSITGKTGNVLTKRAIIIDCTRYDPMTGERGFENTPMLEFVGDKCNELEKYVPGQIVAITFDIQGSRYRNKDGVEQIFTRVHPYKIELVQTQQPTAQPAAQPAQNYQQQPTQYQQQIYQQQQPYTPQQPAPPAGQGDLPF